MPEMQREHIPNQSQRYDPQSSYRKNKEVEFQNCLNIILSTVFLTQEQKEVEIKMLRQSLKLKATPTTDSYQGPKLLKSTSEKGMLLYPNCVPIIHEHARSKIQCIPSITPSF